MLRYLQAGKFVSLHGIRGELKIYPYCDSAVMLAGLPRIYLDPNGSQTLEFSSLRAANNMVIIKIKGIDTVEAARRYIDKLIYFDREDVALDEGVNYIVDLIGCRVMDYSNGKLYGELTGVTSNGAHDVYHVTMLSGEIRYIPVVPAFIRAIDINEKFVMVSPISGLLED